MGTACERTTTIGMAEGGNERDSHTTRVCQATLRPGSVLAGPRRADEGHGSPTAEGRTRERSPTAPCRPQVGNRMKMRTGRRPMLPLASSPACSPAENLQISRVQPPFAFNTKKTRDRKKVDSRSTNAEA